MSKYEDVEFETDAIESFLNDLDELDIKELIPLVAELDRLELIDGKPRFTGDQIALIGKFIDFADNKENQVTDGGEDLDEDDDELLQDEDVVPNLETPATPV